jgi:hypothetical protein
MENKIDIEKVIQDKLGVILDTPYNWSLIVATIFIWIFTGGLFAYSSNNNFDMTTMLQDYIKCFSLTTIIIGFFLKEGLVSKTDRSTLISIGISTYIFSLLTIILMKNFGLFWWLGYWIIKPLGIFSFLLLIKKLFVVISGDKIEEISEYKV